MPDKEFLEEYPLYRRFPVDAMPRTVDKLSRVNLKMACPVCQSEQTFLMTNQYWDSRGVMNTPTAGEVLRLTYSCAHCQTFVRVFYIKADDNAKWFMKVGQYPAWETRPDSEIERLLGDHAPLFKKGLVCESQGYGIGAFGYYRRIVEEVIDQLLDDVADLMSGDERLRYEKALASTKQTVVTQEKIDLVKDLLPPILRPEGMNPLSVLHSSLSEGLHAKTDEECLSEAGMVREILTFLVNQVAASRAASKGFTSGMRKLLDKRAAKSS